MKNEMSLNLSEEEFGKPGLYLLFPDGGRLDFTKDTIEKTTAEFWSDLSIIPLEIRKAVDFKRCSFCPRADKEDICDAIRPTLPFINAVDPYFSYDKVTAVYREEVRPLFHVSYTTMQQALRYLSILSLIHYCRYGAKYRKYFHGIMPLMPMKDIVIRLYENIFVAHKGDREIIDERIKEFYATITAASTNQVQRLGLIAKSDSYLNAFAATQAITELLTIDKDRAIKEIFFEN